MGAAKAVPSWCHYVPTEFQGVACRGSSASGCTCSSFCKDTSADSWSNNPECCACQASQSAPVAAGGADKVTAFMAPQQLIAKAVPSWCQHVPTEFQGAACRGSRASGCTCSSFCKDRSADSWSNNPECCACQA